MEERKLMEVDDSQKFKQKLLNYFRDIVSPYHTFTHISNGHSLNVMVSPNYGGGLTFVLEDITEKLTIEREYNSLFAIQKETIENLYEGILVFGIDNRVRMVNQSLRNIWSVSKDKNINGMHIKDFFILGTELFLSEDAREAWISQVISISERRKEMSGILEFNFGKKIDYAHIPLPNSLNLIRFVDVTDRFELEKNLAEQAKTIEQIDRLKTRFISNMSHELMVPVNTINGFSEILLNQYFGELNQKQQEYCASILSAASKLAQMINTLLGLSYIESFGTKMRYKNISLSALLNYLQDTLSKDIAERNIDLVVSITSQRDSVYADEFAIKQMLLQILSMVVTTTQIDGSIELTASDATEMLGYVDISIKHIGVGLSEEQFDKINRILSEHKNTEDVPLIASDFLILLAHHIVEMHNGQMIVKSNQSEYTEFTFRLPTQHTGLVG
jgi:signal transduction histidine kinase